MKKIGEIADFHLNFMSLCQLNPSDATEEQLMMEREDSEVIPDELVDRISDLPDSILTSILTNIPTKDAVVTGVLSKRWQSVWKTVTNLDFCLDYDSWKSEEPELEANMKFARFVESVLLHLDMVYIDTFHLVWRPKCIPSEIDSWIATANTRGVDEIVLCAEESDLPFEVCGSVLNCSTLRSLELSGHMFISDAIPVCLPNLDSLKLDSICFETEKAFEKLISGCPMLKYLQVRIDIVRMTEFCRTNVGFETNAFKYVVSSTSLRLLELCFEFTNSDYTEDFLHSNLQLEASSLEHLKLDGYIYAIHVPESLSSLLEAHFGINVHVAEWYQSIIGDSLVKALCASTCAKTLVLSRDCMMALTFATISPPTKLFKRLMRLEVGDDWCCPNLVEDIIQSSDKLEELKLASKYFRCTECTTILDWTPPVEVPRCLSNSLKSVEFTCYTGFDYELKMVGYMLEHGSALEIMKLSCESIRKNLRCGFIQDICDLPRKSPTCKIEFFG